MNYIRILFLILLILIFTSFSDINLNQNLKKSNIKNQKTLSKNYKGCVKKNFETQLSFKTDGNINFLPYKEGYYIKKGEVIAKLDGILYKIKKNEELKNLKKIEHEYNEKYKNFKNINNLYKKHKLTDNEFYNAVIELKNCKKCLSYEQEKNKLINNEINYNILTAPFDCYITKKYAKQGDYVKKNKPILTVCSTNKTKIEILVNKTEINKIDLNLPVKVKYKNLNYTGKIAKILKSNKYKNKYTIEINLEKNYNELKENTNVVVELQFKNKLSNKLQKIIKIKPFLYKKGNNLCLQIR